VAATGAGVVGTTFSSNFCVVSAAFLFGAAFFGVTGSTFLGVVGASFLTSAFGASTGGVGVFFAYSFCGVLEFF